MKLTEWNARLHGLVIFRALLDDDVIAKFVDLTDRMAAAPQSTGAVCDAAASFEAALFEHTTNFGEYLSAAVLEAETVCVRQAAVSEVPPVLQTALDNELDFLRQLCSLTLDELLDAAGAADKLPFLPRWETKAIDLHAAYAQRMSEVGKKGYGMFAKREAEIIRLRYGLGGTVPLTQREIASTFGISRSYVSRIEKRALEKLRAELEKPVSGPHSAAAQK